MLYTVINSVLTIRNMFLVHPCFHTDKFQIFSWDLLFNKIFTLRIRSVRTPVSGRRATTTFLRPCGAQMPASTSAGSSPKCPWSCSISSSCSLLLKWVGSQGKRPQFTYYSICRYSVSTAYYRPLWNTGPGCW